MAKAKDLRTAINILAARTQFAFADLRGFTERQLYQVFKDIKPKAK